MIQGDMLKKILIIVLFVITGCGGTNNKSVENNSKKIETKKMKV